MGKVYEMYESFDTSFLHPFTAILSGPSGCGKTEFTKRLLTSDMINTTFERVVWCYGAYQNIGLPGIEYVDGLDLASLKLDGRPTLIIIDDLMLECVNSSFVSDLFSKKSHHNNCSVIMLIQNFFIQGKHMRNITQNCHYIIIFKSPRDQQYVSVLAKQMQCNFLPEAFKAATSKPYGYLLLDFKQSTPEHLRVRSNVLDDITTVYSH